MIAADLPGHIYYTYNNGVADHSFVKNILPILSATFSSNTVYMGTRVADASLQTKKSLSVPGILRLILNLTLTKVNDFFDDVEKLVDNEIPKISALTAAGGTSLIEITAVLKSISDLKRHFSHQVLIPLKSTYSKIFENSEEILRDIEDLASIALTATGNDSDKFEKFYLALFQAKARLLKLLSQPILGKSKADNLKAIISAFSNIKKEKKLLKPIKVKLL